MDKCNELLDGTALVRRRRVLNTQSDAVEWWIRIKTTRRLFLFLFLSVAGSVVVVRGLQLLLLPSPISSSSSVHWWRRRSTTKDVLEKEGDLGLYSSHWPSFVAANVNPLLVPFTTAIACVRACVRATGVTLSVFSPFFSNDDDPSKAAKGYSRNWGKAYTYTRAATEEV